VRQNDSKHTAQVRDYFDERVTDYDAFYETGSPFWRAFNRIFRKAVFLRRDQALRVALQHGCKTMLDVGCGSGRNSIYFAHKGVEQVCGVDISPEMIREAQQVAERAGVGSRCNFQHLDFMQMPLGPKFDIVVACGVFDYVQQPEEFLHRMAQFANRVIYGSFPGWTLVRTPLRKLRYALRGCPTHFYRRRDLTGLFGRTGFGSAEIMPVASGHLVWAVRAQPGDAPSHQP
jgi:2-polyprenyl-3-methyl-5-hydroxy-6-metoxy-1,4-benzoquinol methylase